jgi:hypothetical protein
MDTRFNERLNRQQLKQDFPQISHLGNSEYSPNVARSFSEHKNQDRPRAKSNPAP